MEGGKEGGRQETREKDKQSFIKKARWRLRKT